MSLINEIASLIKEQDEENIEIYFDNLDEETQKLLMQQLKDELNVSSDDTYASNKMVETLAKKPIITLRSSEIVKMMNFDF